MKCKHFTLKCLLLKGKSINNLGLRGRCEQHEDVSREQKSKALVASELIQKILKKKVKTKNAEMQY